MCKHWTINYVCGHAAQFRLSTCRATFTTRSPNPKKASRACCTAFGVISLRSEQQCGPCQLDRQSRSLEAMVEASERDYRLLEAALAWGVEPTAHQAFELEAARAVRTSARERYDAESFAMTRRFPSKSFARHARPKARQEAPNCAQLPRRRSLLSNEVLSEDVEDEAGADGSGWYDISMEGWTKLEDEVAGAEAGEADAEQGGEVDRKRSPLLRYISPVNHDREAKMHYASEPGAAKRSTDCGSKAAKVTTGDSDWIGCGRAFSWLTASA